MPITAGVNLYIRGKLRVLTVSGFNISTNNGTITTLSASHAPNSTLYAANVITVSSKLYLGFFASQAQATGQVTILAQYAATYATVAVYPPNGAKVYGVLVWFTP